MPGQIKNSVNGSNGLFHLHTPLQARSVSLFAVNNNVTLCASNGVCCHLYQLFETSNMNY